MTLVMAWRSAEMLTVCADTRIAGGDGPITDIGQKLFQVPVDVTPFGVNARSIPKLSVGFAFAGNTLMAQSCCAIASTCLSSLSVESASDEVSPSSIASFFAKSAEYVSHERRFLKPGTPARFEAMIFGWDVDQQEPYVYNVEVDEVEGVQAATCKRYEIAVGGMAYFGSGAPFIGNMFKALEQDDRPKTVAPHQMMEAAIAAFNLQSVGGSLQFATASRDGVRLRPFMRIDETGVAEISVLGCNIRRLLEADGPIPGAGAVVLPVDAD